MWFDSTNELKFLPKLYNFETLTLIQLYQTLSFAGKTIRFAKFGIAGMEINFSADILDISVNKKKDSVFQTINKLNG